MIKFKPLAFLQFFLRFFQLSRNQCKLSGLFKFDFLWALDIGQFFPTFYRLCKQTDVLRGAVA